MNDAYFEIIIKATCFAFMHSLWQGAIIAAIAAFGNYILKNVKPYIRYWFFVSCFLFFLIGFGITFMNQFNDITRELTAGVSAISQQAVNLTINQHGGVYQMTRDFTNEYAYVIFGCWLLIFCGRTFMLSKSLFALQKLKEHVLPVPASWQTRVNNYANEMRIGVTVSIKESAKVFQPIVFGFFKPLILLPTGLLTQLPAKEIEAILYHELAHLRRADYLINIIQSFFTNIFFFNPALLWVSSLIKREREYCCDAMAVEKSGDKQAFISSLVSFAEYPYNYSKAMAFANKNMPLTDRVKKLINNHEVPGKIEQFFISFLILGTFLICLANTEVKGTALATNVENVNSKLFKPIEIPGKNLLENQRDSKRQVQVETPRKTNSSHTKVQQRMAPVTDTIPKGASKEFLDGYNAGRKYSSPGNRGGDKFKTEFGRRPLNRDNKAPSTKAPSHDVKRQMELQQKEVESGKVREEKFKMEFVPGSDKLSNERGSSSIDAMKNAEAKEKRAIELKKERSITKSN